MQAARRELTGRKMDLKEPSPKVDYAKPKSTNWPDARKSRQLSIQVDLTTLSVVIVAIWNDEEGVEE